VENVNRTGGRWMLWKNNKEQEKTDTTSEEYERIVFYFEAFGSIFVALPYHSHGNECV